MRNALILLFALFAGTAFAQAPVIDSMLIDESKGILSVYGDFGTAQGKVWCDSVELPVLSWSASLVTTTIPDTGKGSAGGVVVGGKGYRSKETMLTYFSGEGGWVTAMNSRSNIAEEKVIKFAIRVDIHSLYKIANDGKIMRNFYPHKSCQYDFLDVNEEPSSYCNNYVGYRTAGRLIIKYPPNDYEEGCNVNVGVRSEDLLIGVSVTNTKGIVRNETIWIGGNQCTTYSEKIDGEGFGFTTNLDSTGSMKTFDRVIYSQYGRQGSYLFLYKSQYLPPPNLIYIRYFPQGISPVSNQSNIGTDDILLKWNPLKYMDGYHIQLSKDSLINGQRAWQAQQGFVYIVDTIVSSLDFTLPPLEKNTKYYWRVCGVNTEGESRWSDVWSFTTGTSTDVKQEQVNSISLACYPNPAMNELTIVTSEPTRLLLYDVTGKIIKSEQTLSNQTKWDLSLLPNGTYIIGTSQGEMKVVQIVK